MYRSDLKTKDRGGAIAAVVAVHAALLVMLLSLSGHMDVTHPEDVLRVFDVSEVPPPPAQPVPPQTPQPQKPKQTQGAASPKNIKSTATDIVAPKPEFSMPVPVPST